MLINVPGPHDNREKAALIASPAVQEAIRQQEARLAGDGRILVRPSGTEALLRVMVESGDIDTAQDVAKTLADIIKNIQIS